ncbi:MAG: hypothetical protein MJA27_10450 [Pseudanabaenales cyanobacterium]|nr:hypothetical protein [Pseudanabaenales cyanobacterium]
MPPPPTKRQAPPTKSNKTIGQVCCQQGKALIEKLILFAHDCWQQGETATDAFSKLFAKQNKEVAA